MQLLYLKRTTLNTAGQFSYFLFQCKRRLQKRRAKCKEEEEEEEPDMLGVKINCTFLI